MTKEKYIALKAKAEKEGYDKLSLTESWEMDQHIKTLTLKTAKNEIKKHIKDKNLMTWIMLMLDTTYGSVETDNLLMYLKSIS